jgi:hypothetical protein
MPEPGFPCSRCKARGLPCLGSNAPHEVSMQQEATPTRCTKCKKEKKGCDLGETGIPCSRCKSAGELCVGYDVPRGQRVPPTTTPTKTSTKLSTQLPAQLATKPPTEDTPSKHKLTQATKQPSAEASALAIPRSPTWLFEHAYTPSPVPEFLSAAPNISREGFFSPQSRSRSASPQRDTLFSDKCDNCQQHGRVCEDDRPCRDCMSRELVCIGIYLDDPYRSRRTDRGSEGEGEGWGTFGEMMASYGDLNGRNNPSQSEGGQWNPELWSSYEQHQTKLQNGVESANTKDNQ